MTDANGHGVAGVAVRADGTDRVPWRYAMTDADGRYSFPPCQYGNYRVELYDEGCFRELPRDGVRLPNVFLPQVVELAKSAPTEQQLDFHPTESVRMTARYTTSDDQPVSGRSLSVSGTAKDLYWWGLLREVPDQPGLYEMRVPRGFVGRIDQNADNGGFLRITRDVALGESISQRYFSKFDDEGVSFHVVQLKPSSVTLRPTFDGQPVKPSGPLNFPQFANSDDAEQLGARGASSQSRTPASGGLWFDVHPDVDLKLKLVLPGFEPWEQTVRIPEGEARVIQVPLVPDSHQVQLPQQKPKSETYAAKLPSGAEIELAGLAFVDVAYDDGSKRRRAEGWWRPDGTKLDAAPFQPFKVRMSEHLAHYREFAFRLTPPRKDTPVTVTRITASPSPLPASGFGGGWDSNDPDVSFMKFDYRAGFKDENPVAVHVYISDHPFGPPWQIDLDGKEMPSKDIDDVTRTLRSLIKILRVEKSVEVGKTPEKKLRTLLRHALPPDHSKRMDFEVVAISKQGETLFPIGHLTDKDGYADMFPVDISHFEIKLRPTTHKVTFENVSLVSGQATDVTVKVEPVDILEEKEVHVPLNGKSNAVIPLDQGTLLADTVREFNAENKQLGRGLDQPALTESEVIVVLQQDQSNRANRPLNEEEIAAFKEVALSKRLPNGSLVRVYTEAHTDTFVFRKLWQIQLVIPSIGRDGFVGLTIRNTELAEEKIDPQQIAWGKPDAQGLSLGAFMSPKKDKYGVGERVKLRLFARNEGKQPVDNLTFYNISWPDPEAFTVTDQSGATVGVRSVHDEWSEEKWVAGAMVGGLAPGDAHAFHVPFELAIGGDAPSKLVGRVIDAKAGQKLQLKVREHNGNDRERKEGEAAPESGRIAFAVAEDVVSAKAVSNPVDRRDPVPRANRDPVGMLRGVVTLVGKRPTLPHIFLGQPAVGDKPVPDESMLIGEKAGIANVVIYLKQAPANWIPTPVPNEPVLIEAIESRFSPRVAPLRVGQQLKLKNSMNVVVNFHSVPTRGDPFNLFGPVKEERTVEAEELKAESVPFGVCCDIYPWMQSWIMPLDHPFVAVTDQDGHFEIAGLPPGDYEFRVWHERGGFLERKLPVRVAARHATELALEYGYEVSDHRLVKQNNDPVISESGYPVIKQEESELPDGWIACEFGLQYRVRAESTSLVAGELPLIFVDVRNRGRFNDMGLEMFQSRHSVVVNGHRFLRADKAWAGVTPLEPGGKPLTLSFALSEDWLLEGKVKTPLRFPPGKHPISIPIKISPIDRSSDEPQSTPVPRRPVARLLVCRPIEIEVGPRDWPGPPGSLGLENIRREVIAVPEFHSPKVPANLRRLIQNHQPAAGEFLVKLIKSDDADVWQAASAAFADSWDSMNRESIEGYLFATRTHHVWQRSQYPQGIDAAIGMGPGNRPANLGLPPDREYSAETVTTLFLDGHQVNQPYTYPGLALLSHWIKTKDLSLGRHTFRLATKFKFTCDGETYRGEYNSQEFVFEMVPATTPDDLIAPPDEQLDLLVREALKFVDTEDELNQPLGKRLEAKENEEWYPQIRYGKNNLGVSSLHCPVWKLAKRVPVDLCFLVEFQVENTDSVIRCYDLLALTADGEQGGYFSPRDLSKEMIKHADKDGFVSGRLVLTASRAGALTNPKVKRYYGGEITSPPMRFKVSFNHAGAVRED